MPTTARCSGLDTLGLALSLGLISSCTSAMPGAAVDDRRVTALAAGGQHTCARFADGAVRCWGYCDTRCAQPGDGSPAPPLRIEALPPAEGVAVSDSHGCAWHADGRVSCWGSNFHGALGVPDDVRSPVPVVVPGVEGVVELVARSQDTCARHRDGGVTCWGGVARVAHETDEQAAARQPRRVEGARFGDLVARPGCNCALTDDGAARCQALGLPGAMMANGEAGPAPQLPCSIDRIDNVREIVATNSFGCALDRAGKVQCWGELVHEVKGDQLSTWPGPAPREVAGLSDVTALVAGNVHVCALKSDGSVWCFGQDGLGQISGREGKPTAEPRRVEF